MRKYCWVSIVLALVSGVALAGPGNGTPKGGADYSLQIIAFDQCPAGTFTGSNRRQIAVQADLGSGVCSDDRTEGCELGENGQCGGADCLPFGVCAGDGTTSCKDDFECDEIGDAQPADCEGDGFCAGSGDTVACFNDQDCLEDDEFCTAGPLPVGNTFNNISKTNVIQLWDDGTDGDFNVVDGNACDGDGAILALPTETGVCDTDVCVAGFDIGDACDTDKRRGRGNDTSLSGGCRDGVAYAVFVRLVGPNGKIGVTLCAEDDGAIFCSSNHLIQERTGGKSTFADVTTELLTLCFDDPCTKNNSVALFDPDLSNFFWQWNTEGRPHAQVKFYHLSSLLD